MARMYARKKGKSGSKKPLIPADWVEYSPEEVIRLVVKLRKDGLSASKIGLVLRDQYGIPSVKSITGKSILQILKENKINKSIPEDLYNLLKHAVKVSEHLAKNKKDYSAKRGLILLESKIRRLVKYYIKKKELPADWKYDIETAKLIVQKEK
ncbi:MAG: 30S ribosomal protein S15 [Nitrososphaerota archaeon]|nr:30S ribosomal protein S15 [Candidatus Aenigmarchaeota archaeon]